MSRLALALLLLAATGCEKTRDLYAIVSSVETNSCGSSGLPLPDKLKYTVQLTIEDDEATWKIVPRGAPIAGKVEDDSFLFNTRQVVDVGSVDAGTAGCTIVREETLQGTLELADAGARRNDDDEDDEFPLVGEHRITFRADQNGSCRSATGPLAGLDRLPCEARYSLTGEPKEAR